MQRTSSFERSPEPRLILASASPRRREILTRLGIPHTVAPVVIDEDPRRGEAALTYLSRIVEGKLAAALAAPPAPSQPQLAAAPSPQCSRKGLEWIRLRRSAVLVADTTVVLDGQILGKAQSDDEAMAMLESLSGRGHEVMTRFAIASTDVASAHAQTVVTRVRMARLPRQCLHAYVASGEWRDKAGAYAIQGAAEAFVEGIEGSFSNVVGLPAHEVFTAVRRLLVDAPSLEQPPS